MTTPPITGSELVNDRYGEWIAFHDAEVVRLELDRRGPSLLLDLRTPPMRALGGAAAPPCLVTLRFEGIEDETLELAGFNRQNAILRLDITPEGPGLAVQIQPTYGLGGRLVCQTAAVLAVREWEGAEPSPG